MSRPLLVLQLVLCFANGALLGWLIVLNRQVRATLREANELRTQAAKLLADTSRARRHLA